MVLVPTGRLRPSNALLRLALVAAFSAIACGPVVVSAVGLEDDVHNAVYNARTRGTFDEAKNALSALASAEQAHFRSGHGWVLFGPVPDQIPTEPVSVPVRPEWAELSWAPPNPTRFSFQAEDAMNPTTPTAHVYVQGFENGKPVRFDMHVTDGQMSW